MNIREFFFTAFYSGYCPKAPGTAGTLVAMAIYVAENLTFSGVSPDLLNIINFSIVAVLIYPSVKISDYAEKFYNSNLQLKSLM